LGDNWTALHLIDLTIGARDVATNFITWRHVAIGISNVLIFRYGR
jgi:hypothetical protein